MTNFIKEMETKVLNTSTQMSRQDFPGKYQTAQKAENVIRMAVLFVTQSHLTSEQIFKYNKITEPMFSFLFWF